MSRSRLITKPFLAVTAATAAFFVYVGILVPVLPRFIDDELGGGEFGVGLSVAVFALAAVFARPMIAGLINRYGRRLLIQAGALLAAVAGFATVLVDSLLPALVLRGVAGVGEAALFVAAATLVADLAPPERRAEAASYFSVAVFGGLGVGPIIGEAVRNSGTNHTAFAVAAGFAVLAAVLAVVIPDLAIEAEDDGEHAPVPLLRALVHPAALGPGLVLASGIGAFAVFSSFVPEHSRDVGLSGSGAVFAIYSVVCLTLRLTGARLPERLGARRAVTIALTGTSSALALLAAVPRPWALWAAAVLIGVGQAFLYPSLMAVCVNRVGERERATALGSFTMFFDVGTVAGGVALGSVAQLLGLRAAFAGGVVVALFGMWLLWTGSTTTAPAVAPAPSDTGPLAPTPRFVPVAGD